ncbi:MAG: hypothetical protein GY869_22010 [Planctomycetes bacterium]|nr:hypothetical protein [Planctomycetota bacterium]
MIPIETTNTYTSGSFPSTTADNSSGTATTDGFEFVKAYLDNSVLGPQQAIMAYAAGGTNVPTGSVGVPNSVAEAAGVSQIVEALHKMTGSGPGTVKPWMKKDNPSVTGDRVLLLSEQGILYANYPALDGACYVGDGNNATVAAAGGKFYRSSDSAGTTANIAGPYLQLPPNLNPTFMKEYSEDNGDFTITGTNWATSYATAIPYKTSDGIWRLKFNLMGSLSPVASSITLTFNSVTFSYLSGITAATDSAGDWGMGFTAASASTFQVFSSTARGSYRISGDVELNAKPTWADDFDVQWGITY